MKAIRLFLVVVMTTMMTWTLVAQDQVRAIWMSPASGDSPEAARRAVASAVASGYTSVLVPISPHIGPPQAFGEILANAHERGIRVYASINVSLVTAVGELPASRDHVIYQHPEWLMVPRELAGELMKLDARNPDYVGRLARWTRANSSRAAGLYVSPLHGEAVAYMIAAVREVVQRFDVDGAQLEALGYPGDDFDYSRLALDLFRADVRSKLARADRAHMDQIEAIDPFAYAEEFSTEWRRFRQSRLTGLVTRLRTVVKTVRPNAIVSVGIVGDPDAALRDNLQDWRVWVDNGLVDAVSRRDGAARSILFTRDALPRMFQPTTEPNLVTEPAASR